MIGKGIQDQHGISRNLAVDFQRFALNGNLRNGGNRAVIAIMWSGMGGLMIQSNAIAEQTSTTSNSMLLPRN